MQNYNLDPSRLVFQHDNDHKHTSKSVQEWEASKAFNSFNACIISGFESHWALLGTSQTTLEEIDDTSKRSKNYGSVCVQCIPISMNMIAWHFMRARHKELMLCWRERVIGLIAKDFISNLNKTEYQYIVFNLALQDILLLLILCEIFHICAQVCAVTYPVFKLKKPINCLWLSVEGESVQSMLNFVCNCIYNCNKFSL